MYFDGKSIMQRKGKRIGPRAIKQEQRSLYKNICDTSAMCLFPTVLFDHTYMMTAQYVVRALAGDLFSFLFALFFIASCFSFNC